MICHDVSKLVHKKTVYRKINFFIDQEHFKNFSKKFQHTILHAPAGDEDLGGVAVLQAVRGSRQRDGAQGVAEGDGAVQLYQRHVIGHLRSCKLRYLGVFIVICNLW